MMESPQKSPANLAGLESGDKSRWRVFERSGHRFA
jgi:hypothetical protein